MPITSEVDKVNDRLKDLFKLDESFVIALNGEWGIGKTHFWNKFVEENLTKKLVCKEVAYVSLFGKNTLSDIESDIVMQVSQTEKVKNPDSSAF